MTERLDRIESLLESTAQRLDQTVARQTKSTEDVDTFLGAIALSEARVDRLIAKAEAADRLSD